MTAAKEITLTVARDRLQDLDPQKLVGELKQAGFQFAHEQCPIKLAGDGGVSRNPDGSVTFRQTIGAEQ